MVIKLKQFEYKYRKIIHTQILKWKKLYQTDILDSKREKEAVPWVPIDGGKGNKRKP